MLTAIGYSLSASIDRGQQRIQIIGVDSRLTILSVGAICVKSKVVANIFKQRLAHISVFLDMCTIYAPFFNTNLR